MTPSDMKRALSLWKRYKTETREYRELAEKNGMNTGELNRRCSEANRIKREQSKCNY